MGANAKVMSGNPHYLSEKLNALLLLRPSSTRARNVFYPIIYIYYIVITRAIVHAHTPRTSKQREFCTSRFNDIRSMARRGCIRAEISRYAIHRFLHFLFFFFAIQKRLDEAVGASVINYASGKRYAFPMSRRSSTVRARECIGASMTHRGSREFVAAGCAVCRSTS